LETKREKQKCNAFSSTVFAAPPKGREGGEEVVWGLGESLFDLGGKHGDCSRSRAFHFLASFHYNRGCLQEPVVNVSVQRPQWARQQSLGNTDKPSVINQLSMPVSCRRNVTMPRPQRPATSKPYAESSEENDDECSFDDEVRQGRNHTCRL